MDNLRDTPQSLIVSSNTARELAEKYAGPTVCEPYVEYVRKDVSDAKDALQRGSAMTDLRDKIAQDVWEKLGTDYTFEDALKERGQHAESLAWVYDITDAILATIAGSIPDLVWNDRNRAGHYRIERTYGQDKHEYILMCGLNPVWAYDDVEVAKSAANAHHKTRLKKAMGWTV